MTELMRHRRRLDFIWRIHGSGKLADPTFYLLQLSASDAVKRVEAFCAAVSPKVPIQATVTTGIPGVQLSVNVNGADYANSEEVVKFQKIVDIRPHVRCERIDIRPPVNPKQASNPPQVVYSVQNVGGQIVVHHIGSSTIPAIEIVDAIHASFNLSPRERVLVEALPEGQRDALAAQDRAAGDLRAQVERLASIAADQIQRTSDFIREATEKLDAEFAAKRHELEQRAANERGQLEDEKKKFDEKVAEFETRESRYVRRHLLEKMEQKIEAQKEIELSKKTGGKRRLIHVVSWLGMLAFSGLAGTAAYKVISQPDAGWQMYAMFSTMAIAFIAMLVFYVSWVNAWFKEHADAEFRNMRFSADILRASWLAELVFEWETEKKEALPASLIDRLSANLFSESKSDDVMHPAASAISLLAGVNKVKVDRDGVEITRSDKASK